VNENQPLSGSRWEPAPADAPQPPQTEQTEQATGLLDHPVAAQAGPAGSTTPGEPPARVDRPGRRRRMFAAAVGAGLLLVGGAGGYAIGHATAGVAAPTVREHRTGGPGDFRNLPGGPDGTGDDATGSGTGTGPAT
jgi:hypothetical protein